MLLMVVCGVLVVLGVVAIVRWGGIEFPTPPPESRVVDVIRRYVWFVTVALVSGLGAGLLVGGAGGRLVMRLLAVTAPDAAQGRLTEAEETVGRITTGGTIGFILFGGLLFGVVTAALYLLVRRWLPAGRLGGLAFGALLLVVAATRIEPLRKDNPDFDLVGPSWLALLAFSAVVLAHGMLVVALANRYASTLPLPSWERASVLRHAPLAILVLAFPLLFVLVPFGIVVVGVSQVKPLLRGLRARAHAITVGGRVALSVLALVSLPGFVSTVSDIAGRGP